MRDNEEIKTIVEGAFAPLRCVAEIWDYEKSLRFRVFDAEDQAIVTFPDLKLRTLRADPGLRSIIEGVRNTIETKGFTLESWTLPPKAK